MFAGVDYLWRMMKEGEGEKGREGKKVVRTD